MRFCESKYRNTPCPEFAQWIDIELNKDQTVLDLGCGNGWYHSFLNKSKIKTVDAFSKCCPDFLMDMGQEKLPFDDNSFDCVLMFDVIEHMKKENGIFSLKEAKRVCSGALYLLTPLQWDDNHQSFHESKDKCYYFNEYIKHLSLWGYDDFTVADNWIRVDGVFNENHMYLGFWRKHEI